MQSHDNDMSIIILTNNLQDNIDDKCKNKFGKTKLQG